MKNYIPCMAEAAAATARLASVARATFGSRMLGNRGPCRDDGGIRSPRQSETSEPGRHDVEEWRWSAATRRVTSATVIAAVIALVAGVAVATPGSGTSATVVARAGFADHVDLKLSVRDGQGRDTIHIRNTADTVMQQIVFGPDAVSGWHSHPGPAVILIKSGQLTFYSEDDRECRGRTFSAGQAFIEPPGLVHFAHNPSLTEIAEVGVAYFDVPPDLASPRIDEPAPGNCPF